MPQVKFATFNVEWLVLAFGGKWNAWQPPTIPVSFPGGKVAGVDHEPIEDVHGMCRRLAGVINAVDAKIIGIQEAPPLKAQMEAFVAQFLDDDYVVHHSNSKWQSISSLVHKSIANRVSVWELAQPMPMSLQRPWAKINFYAWGGITEAERTEHRLDRHPLLLNFKPSASRELRFIVLHTKSKFSKLKTRQQWEARDRAAILDALIARAKLSSEVFRLRQVLDHELKSPISPQSIIVMGDLNDGPFAELMETEFLVHNVADELVGSVLHPHAYFQHAMTPEALATAATTRFPDPLRDGLIVEELIDHILLSPAIWSGTGSFRLKPNSCVVETQAYEEFNDDTGPQRRRGLRPSDHKPVSAVLEY